MERIGIGIIGTGSIVNTYVQCIKALDNAELVALYSNSPNRAKEAEKQFETPVFTELEAFLDQPEISLVCICNQSGLHGEMTLAAARHGKHVLCEKPLEVTTEKIDVVIAACERNGVILGCVLQNRCSDTYRAVERVVKNGSLGKLLLGNAHINWYRSKEYYANNPWRGTLQYDGGAAFMNQGIHTVDLLLNLMGDVQSVFGSTKTRVHDIEGEDVGAAVLQFKNGAIGTLTAGTALVPGYPERLEIYGEKGSILLEGGNIKAWNVEGVPKPDDLNVSGRSSGAADPGNIGHLNHLIVLRDMLAALLENRVPLVGGLEARKAVEVITAVYRSSAEERPIAL